MGSVISAMKVMYNLYMGIGKELLDAKESVMVANADS